MRSWCRLTSRRLRACRALGIAAHPGFEMLIQQVPEYLSLFGLDSIAESVKMTPSGVRALFESD